MIAASQWASAASRPSLRPSIVARCIRSPLVSKRPASLASIIKGMRKEERIAKKGDVPSWAIKPPRKRGSVRTPWQRNTDSSDVGRPARSSVSQEFDHDFGKGANKSVGKATIKGTSREASKDFSGRLGRDTIKSTNRETGHFSSRVSSRDTHHVTDRETGHFSSRGSGGSSRVVSRPAAHRSETRRDSWDQDKTSKALEGSASERQRHKLRRKLGRRAAKQDEDPDDSGRQTRRKRFLDPDSQFGKKSMVYLIKHGGLKNAIELQDPVQPKHKRAVHNNWRGGRPVEPEEASHDAKSRGAGSNPSKAPQRSWQPSTPPSVPRRLPERLEAAQGDMLELASAGSTFIYGRSSVKAALEQGRRKLYKLYVYKNRKVEQIDEVIMQLAQECRVSTRIVPIEERGLMDKMSLGRPHNGIILEASPLPQLPVLSLGAVEETPGRLGFNVNLDYQSREDENINGKDPFVPRCSFVTPKPFVLLLNNILDPGNLGALLRSAHYFGIDAVGITVRASSSLSAAALKAASGAAEEVRLFTVPSAAHFVEQSKMAGWKTYAAVPPPSKKLIELHGDKFVSERDVEREDPLQHEPCLLVLGNEGQGLTKALKSVIDYEVSIPRIIEHSQLDSLNVSVAGALLCHSFTKGSAAVKAEAAAAASRGRAGARWNTSTAGLAEGQHAESLSERLF